MPATMFSAARVSALLALFCGLQAATVPSAKTTSPTAVATAANVSYCFARVRGLDPERLPPAYLVLRLRVAVSYLNEGTRPLIVPREHRRIVSTGLKPGQWSVFKPDFGLLDPTYPVMKILPAEVSPDNPTDPKNDFFTVIPAGGEMMPPLLEEVILPVSRKGVFRKYPDLRGRRVYVTLRFVHRELNGALEADLSDRWARFGVPWTGSVTSNVILIDVPVAPQAEPCKDDYTPAHPVVSADDKK
jgi:hypothetical protein